ncbi:MAG TPA: rRNA adenine N-6-methyltransferase family protein, partial [Thermomicrobiales bacterium]
MSESGPQTDDEAGVTPAADKMPVAVPPTWRAILRELAVRPSKGKGQNFLTDQAIVARIADAAALAPGAIVVEVGPGLGILTAELLTRIGAEGRLIAVELDRRLAAYIREEFAAATALTVVEGDILRQSPAALLAAVPDDAPYTLVANLPYNITSAVLRHFLDDPR